MVAANGVILPVSAQDVVYVDSIKHEGMRYVVRMPNYRRRTRIYGEMMRRGLQSKAPADMRAALRKAVEDFLVQDQIDKLGQILDEVDAEIDISDEDKVFVKAIEMEARKQVRAYAELFAAEYESNRELQWISVQHTLSAIENMAEGVVWVVGANGIPTDECLDTIPEEDLGKLIDLAIGVTSLSQEQVKNSDSPSE